MSKSYVATWEYRVDDDDDTEPINVEFQSDAKTDAELRDAAAVALLAQDPSKAALVVAIMQVADLKIQALVK